MTYNWQQQDWRSFRYDAKAVESDTHLFLHSLGEASGLFQSISPKLQEQSLVDLMIAEALKTSEIEGEYLSREDVLSSIKVAPIVEGCTFDETYAHKYNFSNF